MDYRDDNRLFQNILDELLREINQTTDREPRNNRTGEIYETTRQNTRNQNTNMNSDTRQQFFDTITSYQNNIRLYQDNMRSYQDNMLYFITSLTNQDTDRTPRPNNPTMTPIYTYPRYPQTNTRTNYLQGNVARTRRDINLPSSFNNNSIFRDVVVRPTEQQIQNATRTFHFLTDMSNINMSCPITLEDFQEDELVCQIKHCRHTFKDSALKSWFEQNVRCPVCRYDIRDYPNESGIDISNNQTPRRRTTRMNTSTSQENVNNLVDSLTTGLTSILQNYMNGGTNNVSNVFDGSLNNILTIEFPITYYTYDTSLNYDFEVD